jgi:hypothetical protein
MEMRLKVFSPYGNELLLDLGWDGQLIILEAAPGLLPAIERWQRIGFLEYLLGEPGQRPRYRQRVTQTSEPTFLKHLSENLQRCYGFNVEYSE